MVCTHLRRPCCCPLLDLTVSCAATAALAAKGVLFQTPAQLQRGGLLVLNGVAYAGYGGNSGDCQECELPVQHPLSRPMMAPGVCTSCLGACAVCGQSVLVTAFNPSGEVLVASRVDAPLQAAVGPISFTWPGLSEILSASYLAESAFHAVLPQEVRSICDLKRFTSGWSRPGAGCGRSCGGPCHGVQLQHERQQGGDLGARGPLFRRLLRLRGNRQHRGSTPPPPPFLLFRSSHLQTASVPCVYIWGQEMSEVCTSYHRRYIACFWSWVPSFTSIRCAQGSQPSRRAIRC